MAETMRAAQYRRPGEVEIVHLDEPSGDDATIVEIDYCGICGTDLHMMIDGWGTPDTVFGHEWSGRILESGASDLAPGTLVVGLPDTPCGRCDRCAAGRTSLCRNRPEAGAARSHGAFAQRMTTPPESLVAVPPGIDAREAAYTEPLAVALHAVTLSAIGDDQAALVIGAGPIGAAIIAILVDRGIRVRATELSASRAALAAELGATVIAPTELDVPAHPGQDAADAADVVFETSGARAAAEQGLTQVTAGGLLMLVGTGLDAPRIDTNRVILNEIRITGAFNYDAAGFTDALALIGSGRLPLDLLIEPQAVGLDAMMDAMLALRAGTIAGKVLVTP
ncbi:MAG: alcohol dehydrogenase catalytic domain-containing protein [Acidimicrobiales bacterium]|nr:alcohol dehydrogenase catalytic domain-containing protein [Acidimicrobiales bacterium]